MLRDSILRSEPGFEPGSRISVSTVARVLGVSPTPVKEALLGLQADGLVVIRPRRSAEVATLTIEDILEIREVRHGLERWAVAVGSGAFSVDLCADMRSCLESWRAAFKANDLDCGMDCHLRFHRLLISSAGNSRLIELYESLMARVRIIDAYQRKGFGRPSDEIKRHGAILEAVERGDREATASAIDDHFSIGTDRLIEKLQAQGIDFGRSQGDLAVGPSPPRFTSDLSHMSSSGGTSGGRSTGGFASNRYIEVGCRPIK